MARVNVTFNDEEMEHIEKVCEVQGISNSEYVRKMYFEGKKVYGVNENIDFFIELIDERLKAILKPQIERLAALSVKGGIMSASSVFLNAQALQDISGKDMRYEYERARLKGIEYIKSKMTDITEKDLEKSNRE